MLYCMMKIASYRQERTGAEALVTGESLGPGRVPDLKSLGSPDKGPTSVFRP
jgi:adenylyl- and sulfurtransferase ThiI